MLADVLFGIHFIPFYFHELYLMLKQFCLQRSSSREAIALNPAIPFALPHIAQNLSLRLYVIIVTFPIFW